MLLSAYPCHACLFEFSKTESTAPLTHRSGAGLAIRGLHEAFHSFQSGRVLMKAGLDPESVGSSTELCGCNGDEWYVLL